MSDLAVLKLAHFSSLSNRTDLAVMAIRHNQMDFAIVRTKLPGRGLRQARQVAPCARSLPGRPRRQVLRQVASGARSAPGRPDARRARSVLAPGAPGRSVRQARQVARSPFKIMFEIFALRFS